MAELCKGLKVEGTSATEVTTLANTLKRNNEIVSFVEQSRQYTQEVKFIAHAEQGIIQVSTLGDSSAVYNDGNPVNSVVMLGNVTGRQQNHDLVAKAAQPYIGYKYLLGSAIPLATNGTHTADCATFTWQVLHDLGVDWISHYVPSIMEEAQQKGLWVAGDAACNNACVGDMIVTNGDNHVILSDGKNGCWHAGCTKGVSYEPDWRGWLNAPGTGYVRSSALIAAKHPAPGSSSTSDKDKKPADKK